MNGQGRLSDLVAKSHVYFNGQSENMKVLNQEEVYLRVTLYENK